MSVSVAYIDGTIEQIPFYTYPDGTFYTKWRPSKAISTLRCMGTTVNDVVQAVFIHKALWARGINVYDLYIPFIPGGRQDRINTEGDYLFTLDAVAELINSRGFANVYTVDPHSDVTVRKVNSLRIIPVASYLDDRFSNFTGVIAPDEGAKERAGDIAEYLGLPLYRAGKVREVETGKLTGFLAPADLPDRGNYLVVDDICDGGGTFAGLAGVLPANAKRTLLVTHGLFTRGIMEVDTFYNEVITIFNWSRETSNRLTVLGTL